MFHPSGHVAGATAVEIHHGTRKIFLTGDVLFEHLRTLKGAHFPIGHFDNAFGGAAMYNPLFNYANHEQTGAFFEARACSAEGYAYRQDPGLESAIWAALHAWWHPLQLVPAVPDTTFAADCNNRGLLAPGEFLVRQMMARGMMIDIDHMSALAANRVLTIAEEHAYPAIVSGHSGPLTVSAGSKASEGAKTPSQLTRIRNLGGLSSVILNQGGTTASSPHGITAHGTLVGLPKQHPAKKQPNRPMTWPSAMPGANESDTCHSGMRCRHMYQNATATARISPP